MNAPRIIPAGPMGLDDILPMIRTLHALQERAGALEAAAERGDAGGVDEYHSAAMLEERIRRPITVAGRMLYPADDRWSWYGSTPDTTLMLTVNRDEWQASMSASVMCGATVSTAGFGPTIAAALADAHARYQAAIAGTLLRMSGLLREVTNTPVVRCPRCLGGKVTISGFDDVAHRCHVCGGSGEVTP